MTKTLARALSLGLVLVVVTVSAADARQRRSKVKKPASDSRVIVLLQRVLSDNEKLRQKLVRQELGQEMVRQELVEIKQRLRPDAIASIELRPDELPAPPTLAAPMPIPDVTKTLDGYRKKIAIDSIGRLPIKGLGNIKGLKPYFVAKLAAMHRDMPVGLGFSVGSGYRTYAQQARLHAQKPRLAARPGRSKHEQGLAGDLRFASSESSRWVHRNSVRYGLRFPMGYEPWHIEPDGATRTRYAASKPRYRYAHRIEPTVQTASVHAPQ